MIISEGYSDLFNIFMEQQSLKMDFKGIFFKEFFKIQAEAQKVILF